MPTTYQFQPLPLANEWEFEEFILDLYNELFPETRFELYGRRGQRQDGIDIINFSKKVVIQCKKIEIANTATVQLKSRNNLKRKFREDLISAVNSKNFTFDKFVFATTFPTDIELQTLAGELSKEFQKDVEYLGWGMISHKLPDCNNTVKKYYNSLSLETTRLSDSKFRESIKDKHIIDQCYESLKRFQGFNFIGPKVISRLFPFKVDDTKSFSLFNKFCLATNNDEFIELFKITELKNEVYTIKRKLEKQVESTCRDANTKLKFIQETLRNNLISCIQTTNGIHHKIANNPNLECDCNICLIDELKFTELLDRLKTKTISLPTFYSFYQLSDFKSAKIVLDLCIKNEFDNIKLPIARYNEYWLSVLDSSEYVSQFQFSSKMRSIESSSEPVQEVILNLEQDKILTEAHHNVDEVLHQIRKIHNAYKSPSFFTNGPDYVGRLYVETLIVYSYYQKNFLIKDVYSEYKSLFRKAFTGWLLSMNTSKRYHNRIDELDVFQLAMSIKNLSGKDLFSILRETKTKSYKISDEASKYLSKISMNYFSLFNADQSIYGDYLKSSFPLQSSHRSIFQSLLFNLAYSATSYYPKGFFSSLLNFIKKQKFLYLYDYKYIGVLFRKKGMWFSPQEHMLLLKHQLQSELSSSTDLVSDLIYSLITHHTGYRIDKLNFSMKLLESTLRFQFNYQSINNLRLISSVSVLPKIDEFLKIRLKKKFDHYLYRQLLIDNVSFLNGNNHLFTSYVKEINKIKGDSVITDENGFEIVQSFEFLNFVSSILHSKDRDIQDPIIKKHLTNLSQYQRWLIDPKSFNYNHFKIDWIEVSNIDIVLIYIGKSNKLKDFVLKKLKLKPDQKLSELYIRMIT